MLLNNEFLKKYGISANGLKILALILMITDHIGAVLLPQYRILRYIGRLSFPIYCFMITEGMLHTSSIYKYAGRILVFALVSEVPFDLAIFGKMVEPRDQNVYFTLLIGLLVIYAEFVLNDLSKGFSVCIVGMLLAAFLKVDYSAYGILMIYCFYVFRQNPFSMTISIGLINFVMGIGGTGSQKYAVLAMIPLFLYSGNKTYSGKNNTKASKVVRYVFYVSYPVHLMILYIIKKCGI